ncbi:MAG: histidine--tRNA ligase [Candidatus Neomarinimicrobiota bacterium]|nr:MAG: histidine--tRNA ligase [Candidatus Neomarinimicrobiota bacterium]
MKYSRVKGTRDILPHESYKWLYIGDKIREFALLNNFSYIKTPAFEVTELFVRGIGNETDIVSKEMYTFLDKSKTSITLKPEMTAPVIRAYIQNNLEQMSAVMRVYYIDALFRQEKPQKGRLRQFHQYGFEIIGTPYPEADAEIIVLSYTILKSLGLDDLSVKINSIGNRRTRKAYLELLRENIAPCKNDLCPTCQTRFSRNVLRIFDCKNQKCQELLDEHAPRIIDHISDEDKEHFSLVLKLLDIAGVSYQIDHKLVRGLDYYTRTTFEITSPLLGSQDALCGGGRYDYLVEDLGGKPTPAVGVAGGIERLLIALEEAGKIPVTDSNLVYIVSIGEKAREYGFRLSWELRDQNIPCEFDTLRRSPKAQMRDAGRKKAKYVVIVGEDELKRNKVILRDMSKSYQEEIGLNLLIPTLKQKISSV